MSLFADGMILYIENPQGAILKLLELINEFGNVQDTKLKHRYMLHFYTLTTKDRKEKLKKQSHLSSHQKE